MPNDPGTVDLQSLTTFGELLRYLRHRAQLTQRDLGIAIGYSEGHINRFEKNKRLPDPSAVAALFVPALGLAHESALAARLMELASAASAPARSSPTVVGEPIPPTPPHEITRASTLALARTRLANEHHLVLSGLPGVGKTTLASTLAREYAARMPVFWLTLTEGVTISANVWVHRLAEFLLAQGHPVEPLLATDPRTQSKLSFEGQLALLSTALTKQPMLLCFDNAELIRQEQACLQMLRHFSVATAAFLLLISRESLPLVKIAEIAVEGLERNEALAYIAESAEHTLDETRAERLLEKTAGNLMLLQLAAGQLVERPQDAETFIAHLETQPQVASYLLQTLQAQSSPAAWRLMLLLAVFEQPVNLYDPYLVELVQTQDSLQNIGEAVLELQRRHLIGDAASASLHSVIREYVYLTLSTRANLRQRLHRLAGDWLKETSPQIVVAAEHYSRADLPDQALDLIEENQDTIRGQGQALSAVAVLDEVRTHLKRRRTDQRDSLRRLLTVRGGLLAGTLRASEGETNLREAVALANNPAVRANIVYRLAELIEQRSDFQETLQLVRAASAELPPDDRLLRARLVSLECIANTMLGQRDQASANAQEALALTDPMMGLPLALTGEIRTRVQVELADIARQGRDLTTAMRHAQAALATARAAQLPRMIGLSLLFVGGLFYDLGDLDGSFRHRREALEQLLATGDVHSAAYVLTNLADIHHLRGEDDDALEKLDRAREILRIVNDLRGLAAAESERTTCLLWLGRIEEARRAIEQLLQEAKGKETEAFWGYRLNKRAVVQLVQGETDAAIATLRQALDLPPVATHRMMRFDLHSTLALAWVVNGDLNAAAGALAETPRFQGLSRWAELDRDTIEGYVALAHNDTGRAREIANRVSQHGVNYPLYCQSAEQLLAAIEQHAPVSTFPRWLWVKGG